MKTIKNLNLKRKRVLLRCDFDVPLGKDLEIQDDFRIQKALPTIKYLLNQKAKIILVAHLGRPGGKVIETMRLTPVQNKLTEYLKHPLSKTQDCLGPEVEDRVFKMREGEILLLENLRFHKGEEAGDKNFARELAKLGEFYINDAFATSHRAHSSITLLPKFLPSAAGLLLEKEVKILSRILQNPWRPLAVVIGGVKIDSKMGVIEKFMQEADHLLLGGEIANTILRAKGIIVGKPLLSEALLEKIDKIKLTDPKIHLPVDGIIALENKETKEDYLRIGGVGSVRKEESVFDIGPETVKVFSQIIKEVKMIMWCGPMGMYEDKKFEKGTKEMAEIIAKNHSAFKVAGGGDTNSALQKFNLIDKFDHVSTGGGAMLEFMSGKKLPGLKALCS